MREIINRMIGQPDEPARHSLPSRVDMPRTPYRASEGNALNNPPCPITPTLTCDHHL